MRQISKLKILICLIVLITISTICVSTVEAAGDFKVMKSATIGEHVKVYVKGVDAISNASYQIGNIPADSPKSYEISNDELPMRTLIMLDNSFSIPNSSREKIGKVINGIVASHGISEQFRIATFSDSITYLSDRYSDDYTAISNMISTITYENQDTMLTDVLYGVLNELNSENYLGYTRIIIITDGVNNKPVGGITLDRVKEELKNSSYPIYTIGSNTGENDDLLDNLFSLSWLTNAEYRVLENSSLEDIISMTSKDNEIVVYDAVIPIKAQTGGVQSSKLTLVDGTEIVFDVSLPFSIMEDDPEAEIIEEVEVPVETHAKVAKLVEQSPKPENSSNEGVVAAILAIAVVLIVAVVFLLWYIRNKKTKTDNSYEDLDLEYEKTECVAENEGEARDTVILTPQESVDGRNHYRFTITDSADIGRSFRCELTDEIQIGRKPDNNIVISDDTAVHGHHCCVTVQNNTFYITDLRDVKNHSSVNGIELKPEIPQLIVTNTKVTIGRHTYVISISEV